MDDRAHLISQMKNRALIYLEIYDVLVEEYGVEKGEALLSKAIYNRGRRMGAAFRRFAPADLAGLREAFLSSVPGGKEIFQPQVLKEEAGALDIQLHGCPLKDAWREARLPEEKVATLCRIAGAVDKGLFGRRRLPLREPHLGSGRDGLLLPVDRSGESKA